ncbi:HK97 gp10 family phage protein [uncultured Eubacterium sp.]|uniref:HK97 gp10 family phage protein n=1 Tax=uncultured Eubacterium sp. TaxID=165185 RepID=UPI002593A781|nr:HK97 gp10 family phage protein [uncultured Eubacterium sp.]
MISFRQNGDFSKLNSYLERIKQAVKLSDLDRFGREGVNALRSATPVDSGLTASSWEYNIERNNSGAVIQFYNTNVNQGVNIAIILQYGHSTKNGGWVEGRDYINPAIQPVFDKLAEEAWKEVTRV